MKGQIKVIGVNELLEEYKNLEGSGSLISIDKDHYELKIKEEKFYYQSYNCVITEDSIARCNGHGVDAQNCRGYR